jgi:hypothetical protein
VLELELEPFGSTTRFHIFFFTEHFFAGKTLPFFGLCHGSVSSVFTTLSILLVGRNEGLGGFINFYYLKYVKFKIS